MILLRLALLMQLTGMYLKRVFNLHCCCWGMFHREVREEEQCLHGWLFSDEGLSLPLKVSWQLASLPFPGPSVVYFQYVMWIKLKWWSPWTYPQLGICDENGKQWKYDIKQQELNIDIGWRHWDKKILIDKYLSKVTLQNLTVFHLILSVQSVKSKWLIVEYWDQAGLCWCLSSTSWHLGQVI